MNPETERNEAFSQRNGSIAHHVSRLLDYARSRDRRVMLGIIGEPGAGKSTLSQVIREIAGTDAAVVAMDGFHLASRVIAGTERELRRGAPDTFDVGGFLSLLRRLRAREEQVVYAPVFERSIEDPEAAAICVTQSARLVLVEGNYLLSDAGRWRFVRELLDETWLVHRPDNVRIADLVARHIASGKTPQEAEAWALGPDRRNALHVRETARRADHVFELTAGVSAAADEYPTTVHRV